MKNLKVLIPAVTMAALVSFAGSQSAYAADTALTAEVNGGDLSISAPGSVALGTFLPGTTVNSVDINNNVVTDARAGNLGWTASVQSTNLTPASGSAILATQMGYAHLAPATVTGTATVESQSPTDLSTAKPVQVASGVAGNNSATWGYNLSLTIPSDALAGTYNGTITHSVL